MAFHCEICVFTTHKKYNFQKHLGSQRHFINENRPKVQNQPKIAEISQVAPVVQPVIPAVDIGFKCKHCGKSYRHKSSLSKHVHHSCKKDEEDDEDVVEKLNKTIESKSKYIEHLKKELQRVYTLLETKEIDKLKNNHF